jgi:putative intracellular protease/amidase
MELSRRALILGGLASVAWGCAGKSVAGPRVGEPRLKRVAERTVVMPLPHVGFDPTESAVPWQVLTAHGATLVFATPDGKVAAADDRMLTGEGLGRYAERLRADAGARAAYERMRGSGDFTNPRPWTELRASDYDALLLPGGHAKGMKPYLESPVLQKFVGEFFASGRPIGAICHGVVLAARSKLPGTTLSVLAGRTTTALPKRMERLAWQLTRKTLGDYYRTYPTYVQDEVAAAVGAEGEYEVGPGGFRRDRPDDLAPGFVVVDGRSVSARWPGDAHRFAAAMLDQLA